jgi:hypothetical protein
LPPSRDTLGFFRLRRLTARGTVPCESGESGQHQSKANDFSRGLREMSIQRAPRADGSDSLRDRFFVIKSRQTKTELSGHWPLSPGHPLSLARCRPKTVPYVSAKVASPTSNIQYGSSSQYRMSCQKYVESKKSPYKIRCSHSNCSS